jgi:hypothetical protein
MSNDASGEIALIRANMKINSEFAKDIRISIVNVLNRYNIMISDDSISQITIAAVKDLDSLLNDRDLPGGLGQSCEHSG